jgi:hypothetical protein
LTIPISYPLAFPTVSIFEPKTTPILAANIYRGLPDKKSSKCSDCLKSQAIGNKKEAQGEKKKEAREKNGISSIDSLVVTCKLLRSTCSFSLHLFLVVD